MNEVQIEFLVTCVEANGFTRGQTATDRPEADRLFDHFVSAGAQYVEIRKLGGRVRHFNKPKV